MWIFHEHSQYSSDSVNTINIAFHISSVRYVNKVGNAMGWVKYHHNNSLISLIS